jgi:hypothetical protein
LIKQIIFYRNLKNRNTYLSYLVNGLLIFFISDPVCGQRELSPQAQHAIDLFNSKQYGSSSVEFKKLLEKYSKDALYQYYLGASLVEMNSSSDEAVEYLKLSLSKNTDYKAWYYLAKIYYRQYRFEEAKNALLEFRKNATWQDNNNYKTNDELERLENSVIFFSKGLKLNISETRTFRKDSIDYYLSKYSNYKPFKPKNILPGPESEFDSYSYQQFQFRFVSAESTMNLKGKDIYVMQKLPDGLWSEPSNIGATVNSSGDEILPHFEQKSGTLYFSSNRKSSVGGFDIFKTHFDSLNKKWTEPRQMLFPVNTPYNELAWIEEENNILFVSDRNTINNYCTLYRIEKTSTPYDTLQLNANDLIAISDLKVNSKKSVSADTVSENKSPISKDTMNSGSDFLDKITQVLEKQKQCDSLYQIIRNLKLKLKSIDDKEVRAKIFSELSQNEKLAGNCQSYANKIYDKTNEIIEYQLLNRNRANGAIPQRDTFSFELDEENVYSDENPVPTETVLPDGIIYCIQLGVYSKPLAYDIIGGLRPVSAEYLSEGKAIKYYVGLFNRFNDADAALIKVKATGFKEAFILAYFNKKKIPLERAKELENRR